MSTESHYHSKKDRVFVRGIEGHYSLKEELKRLRAMPRVRKGKEIKFVDGPQCYSRHYVEPKDGISQMFHLHLEEYAPGGKSQKHGHVNEAAFYILDGTGYEIHDGVRYDWKAGDVAIVHNNCVHQHFNASAEKPARALVINTPDIGAQYFREVGSITSAAGPLDRGRLLETMRRFGLVPAANPRAS